MAPDMVSTTSPVGAEIFSPAARLPSSTTSGEETSVLDACGALSSLPPQAATARAATSATRISRILRSTGSLPKDR
jgi:hypothetical protein